MTVNQTILTNVYLEQLLSGKPTESMQLRFNEREFEIINQAFAMCNQHRSRHAWLADVVMREARSQLAKQMIIIDPETNLPTQQ